MATVAGGPVIGRAAELAATTGRLDDAALGRGAVVFLVGEPGIGKTTLARAITERATARGLATAWGRCREDRGAPSLWPWVSVVTELGLADDTERLESATGPAAPDIELVLGGTAMAAPDDRDPGAVASRRFRLFEGLTRLLASGDRPTCVVLDDVHRADEESIGLLDHLADAIGGLPIVVIATFREGEVPTGGMLRNTVGRLAGTRSCDYLSLGALTSEEAYELVEAIVGPDPLVEGSMEDVIARSAGHPFFLEQLVRARVPGEASVLPPTIRAAVSHRVGRLPSPAIEALGAASVVGRDFAVDPVALILDRERSQVVADLDAAVEAQLVDRVGAQHRFRHAIVRDVLYAELPAVRRCRAHERLANWPLPTAPAVDDLVERAHHAIAAAELGATIDVVPIARRAGLAAAGLMGPRDGARWLDVALDATASVDDRAAIALEAGDAHLRAGAVDNARARFESAFETSAAVGDAAGMALAALAVGRCVVTAGHVDWPLVELLERAAATSPPDAADTRARLLARHGIELYWYDGDRSRELTQQALDLVTSSTPPRVRAEVLFARLFCLRGPGRLTERLAIGTELVELAERQQLDEDEFRGRTWLIPELLQVPDLPRYDANVAALADLAVQTDQPLHHWYADLYRAQAAIARGDHIAGRQLAASALRAGQRSRAPVADVYHIGHEYLIRRDVGGLDEIVPRLEELSARFPAFTTLRALLGLVLVELGERDRAVAEIVRLAHQRFGAVPEDSLWIATIGMSAEVSFHTGLDATGRLAASLLRPHAGTCAVQGLPCCFGAVDRYLGLACAAAGDLEAAARDLGQALDQHRRWGLVPFRLRTELDLARVAIAAGGLAPADRERLLETLATIRTEATARGYARLVIEIDGVAGQIERSSVRHPSGPGGTLSDREAEVLALLAGGATNKDLARDLHISVNTVERHLRNIFTKLGVTNRVEATAVHLGHVTGTDHGSP